MKHKLIVTLLLLAGTATILLAQQESFALVEGRIKNATAGDKIELFVPHYHLDNESSRYSTVIGTDQRFSLKGKVPEGGQLAFLILGDDQLPLYLEPYDSLLVQADLFQFPLVVTLGGQAGANNRVLQQYLPTMMGDFNEFNNVRFKVGNWWFPLETAPNDTMLNLAPTEFKAWADRNKQSGFVLLDTYFQEHPEPVSALFKSWIEAEIVYTWAYHLLMYGSVYRNRYQIEDNFFEFLYEAPTQSEAIGSEAYRQFLLALFARQQGKTGDNDRYFAGQYESAGNLLSGKPLAWFQSEVIKMALSGERFSEILPAYNLFAQTNPYPEFDTKVTSVYERYAQVVPGSSIPAFSGTDIVSGRLVNNQNLKGSIVYLNFWASWCSPCIKKMNIFDAFAQELTDAGVQIVNISIDENRDAWLRAIQEHELKGFQILADRSIENNTMLQFGVQAVPHYFIVAKNGTVVEKPYTNQPGDIIKKLLDLAK
jgi:thiol-disulfide isomerase/thioredoxin